MPKLFIVVTLLQWKIWNLKFFLKIGILSVKVYTKKVANMEACDFTPAPTTTQSIKVVIVVAYYYYV